MGQMRISNARAVPLATGVASMVYVQIQTGWWLDAGARVLPTMLVLFVEAVVLGLKGSGPLRTKEATLWVGAMVGLTACLLYIGPGTIWPIVLVVSGIMTGAAVLLGGFIAAGVSRFTGVAPR
jgi:hypothetical protein